MLNEFSAIHSKAAVYVPFSNKYEIKAGDSRRLNVSKTFIEDLDLDAMPDFEEMALTSPEDEMICRIKVEYEEGSWLFENLN